MAKKISIFQIDAFTDKPFGGNPAGVTFGDGLLKEEMQLIAREMNLAETAFISKSDKAEYNLRWFTPATEVELCGHATIASLHFLMENGVIKDNSEIKFDTRSGILKCGVKNNKYFMQIPVFKIETYTTNKMEILTALGLTPDLTVESSPFLMMENGYLYIHVKRLASIREMQPDFKHLLKLQKKQNFGGAVVFTRETVDKESSAHIRFFAPFYGIDEDPVTGSANGPLMLVLRRLGLVRNDKDDISLIFEQGDIIKRRGRIFVDYSPENNELFISGTAVTVLKGEMIF
jgi:PhzF family phenazine biosynthesis protein